MTGKFSTIAGYWRKRTARERFILALTALVALSWLLYQFPYSMGEQYVTGQKAAVERTREQTRIKAGQIDDLKALDAEIKARGSASGQAWRLVNPKGVFLFFEDVSGEARRAGVNIVSVYPSSEIDKERYKEVSMNLDLKARYRELADYFKRLESLPMIVNIRKIYVEACPDSASVCAAKMEAVAYVEK